jgi:5-methylcytosine-specific restriction endonuclease McrA
MIFQTYAEFFEWAAAKNGMTVEEFNVHQISETEMANMKLRDQPARKVPIPQSTRMRIFCRDLHQCQYCGARNRPLCVDHIFPERHGGSLSDENLITSCRPCNSSKGSKTGKALQKWRANKRKEWGEIK